MKKLRKSVPFKTKSLLQKEIHSSCPICDDQNVDHFEIHHLDNNPENNLLENLLMLCPICHSKITKGDIGSEEASYVKKYLIVKNRRTNEQTRSGTIAISGNANNSIVTNSINAQTFIYKSNNKPKVEHTQGSIGRNLEMKIYIKYLIDQYNKFKEMEAGKESMKYAAIYSIIKKEFRASPYQLPELQFQQLSQFLQRRIENTKLGRMNRGKGIKSFYPFEHI